MKFSRAHFVNCIIPTPSSIPHSSLSHVNIWQIFGGMRSIGGSSLRNMQRKDSLTLSTRITGTPNVWIELWLSRYFNLYSSKHFTSFWFAPSCLLRLFKGARVVMYYYGHSVVSALLNLFPNIGLDRSKFHFNCMTPLLSSFFFYNNSII